MTQTAHSDFGKISKIILKHASDAFYSQEKIDKEWQKLNYLDQPDFEKSKDEYDTFLKHIKTVADEILFLPLNSTLSMDSIYVRDAMITTNKGVILCNMGKAERAEEPKIASAFLKENNIPILGSIKGVGSVEGGDMVWLDETTLAIGEGYRTNAEGIRQVRELTKDFVENIIVVPLVHYLGESDVFHLMSFISPIDSDLAVVYSKLMPVPFRQYLIERGMKFVEVPDDEFLTMGCNVLALAPRKVLMLSGNPITQARLENAGVEVLVYEGEEISKKGCGGPTCLTRPLLRG